MNAAESYKAGHLAQAIEAQLGEVKAHPTDAARRTFLFELLCFSGDLDRARRQLDAIRADEGELESAAANYRRLLDAETARHRLFEEGIAPEFLGEATADLRARIEAVGLLRLGREAEAAALIVGANDALPPVAGTLNGKRFESLRDADDLFAGVLEVMAQGKYFWVALDQVVSVAMNPPRFPRDLLYAPARLELAQETGEVFLPALYPGTAKHGDDGVRLGRVTDWVTRGGESGATLGVGARLYLVDDDDLSLLEWRQLVRDESADEPAAG
jgi:type VI secretion system protein ImpE